MHNFVCTLLRLPPHVYLEERAPHDTFFRNHEPNRVPEMSLSYLQNMTIYQPSGKCILSNLSLLQYSYTIVFVHNILCPLQKYVWFGAWYKQCAQNIFSSECDNNFYQALKQPFQYPLWTKYYLSTDCILKLGGTLTDWLSKHS